MKLKQIGFLLGFWLSLLMNSYSQGPPITVDSPVMLGLEGSGIRTFGRWVSAENGKNYIHVFAVPYNFTSKLQVGVTLPVVRKNFENLEPVSGIGDIAVFVKYQLYKKDGKAKTFRILGKVSQILPTGKTNSHPPIGADIYQTYAGFVLGRITSDMGVYSELGYIFKNKGVTDNLIYNFSISWPLLPHQYPQKQVNLLLEMNGSYFIENKTSRLFLSPGLQLIPGRQLLFETSFQQVIIQNDGLQNKINYQWLLGLRFLIN